MNLVEIPMGTREAVRRLLLERGQLTAPEIAHALRRTVPAVRRHLDNLVEIGHATSAELSVAGERGRGRPPRIFSLTRLGREAVGSGYDELAVEALRFVARSAPGAVREFSRVRASDLRRRYEPAVTAVASADRPDILAQLLSADGYVADVERHDDAVVICQHHCPVSSVATEFPELCEAETEAFSELVGRPVHRHTTIAGGSVSCIAYVESTPTTTAFTSQDASTSASTSVVPAPSSTVPPAVQEPA